MRKNIMIKFLTLGMLFHFSSFLTSSKAQDSTDVQVYLTVKEALLEIFPSSKFYITEELVFSETEIAETRKNLHRHDPHSSLQVVLVYGDNDQFLGYSVLTDEKGKYLPITFMVGALPNFKVSSVRIMVYRESRGSEVRMPRFLHQYKGKTAKDPIRINRDIINITGATISVRAVNSGVKEVLYWLEHRYKDNPPEPTFAAEKAKIEP